MTAPVRTTSTLLLLLATAAAQQPTVQSRLADGDLDGALRQFAGFTTAAGPDYAAAAAALRERALDPAQPAATRIRIATALCQPPGPSPTFQPAHDLGLGKLLLTAAPAAAADLFERVLASPSADLHFDASLQLVGALQNCRRYAAMWQQLDRCAELARPEQAASVHLRRVGCLLQAGLPDQAARELDAVAELPALLPTILRLRLEVLQWNERWTDIPAVADALDALDADRTRTGLIRATAWDRLGDPRGLELLRQLASATTTPESLRRRAVARVAAAALRRDDLAEAERSLALLPLHDGDDELLIAHARTALAVVRAGRAGPPTVQPLADRLAASWQLLLGAWRETPLLPGGRGFLQLALRRDLLAARIQCAEILQPAAAPTLALQWWLEAESLGTTARELGLSPPPIAAVQEHLVPPAGLLLVWLPAPGGGHVLAIDRDAVELLPMAPDRHLRARVRALRDRLRDDVRAADPDDGWRDLATAVAEIVLPPPVVARIARVARIALAGREALGGVPFEALPWSAGEPPFLGAARAVVNLPSLTVAVHTARRPLRPCGHDLALLAGTGADPAVAHRFGVAPLTLDDPDLRAWLPDGLPPGRTVVTATATVDDLLDASVRARMQIVVAHGVFAAERATPAGVLLRGGAAAVDGALFPDLLPDTAPGLADLVVLCTCGAGRGLLRRGDDGGQTLSGALLRAGATVVGIADHDLELASTRALIHAFVTALAAGEPPDLALQAARRTLLADGVHAAHVAAMRLDGPGFQALPIQPRTVRSWLGWWLAAGGVAGLAGAWRWRRRRRSA